MDYQSTATIEANAPSKRTWELIACNLCGSVEADVYHQERICYFGQWINFCVVRCRQCGLVYTNPRLTNHNANYLEGADPDPVLIEQHGRAKAHVFECALDQLAHWVSPGQGRLLDIGSGSGHFLDHARRRGYEVVGLEPAQVFADYARQHFDLDIVQADVANAEFAPQSFDVVTAWDVIEHVADPKAMLQWCVHWLKPDGVLALRFPSASWQKLKATMLHQILRSHRAAFAPNMHLTFFSEATIGLMAEQVGLQVLATRNTSNEANTDDKVLDSLKVVSATLLRGVELILGRSLGNLEVYCRKLTA